MAIFITGDTHGDFRRFSATNFPEQKSLCKEDYVIICGDFGGVWDESKEENYWLDWLNKKPFTTLFVDGNHENFDLLNQLPTEKWNGGKVRFVRDSIMHLTRGQVFNINGKKFFALGGASSHDIQDGILEQDDPFFIFKRKQLDARMASYRINHVSWWKEELPSDEEYETALKSLKANNWQVDYILSHCLPLSVINTFGAGLYSHDKLTEFMEEVKERCDFKKWFCGHYHDNRKILGKHILLYEQIVEI